MSPETVRGLHGLLSSILEEAVKSEPPLRDRNPCHLTRLPKEDDHGLEDDGGDDQAEFLTPDEVAGIVECIARPMDRMLVRTAYGTGMRFGELTALAARHIRSPQPGRHEVRVARAWKRRTASDFYLGPPKTRAGRRTIEITAGLWQELQDFGLGQLEKDALVFHSGTGTQFKAGAFSDRWHRAVKKAKARGLVPEWKFPTFHDLRHSHVAALLSDGHSLTYVQRRLGHESIKTTSDRYGHLLDSAFKAALATLERVMGYAPSSDGGAPEADGGREGRRAVHVVNLAEHQVAFWELTDAEATAERWAREHGGSVDIASMSAAAWVATSSAGRDALEVVRDQMPRRAWVWEVGPVFLVEEGSEVVAGPGADKARGSWRWDFEEHYTEEPAQHTVEKPGVRVVARAWGRDEEAVREAYALVLSEALGSPSPHPYASGGLVMAV
ncbi:site-specific integrase [Streptomyces zaomyceticus]|uniref:site-specific integrase n=1 Tax=Streptomyces zaomyceticus TaxID=68286 RepID=UPI001674E220|nr:site-specific integrase [Streptomyces zaomyceticus]GHG05453.1 hypothetical protein GCM10018791_17350 [Streptomyces zaomyceticus]